MDHAGHHECAGPTTAKGEPSAVARIDRPQFTERQAAEGRDVLWTQPGDGVGKREAAAAQAVLDIRATERQRAGRRVTAALIEAVSAASGDNETGWEPPQ